MKQRWTWLVLVIAATFFTGCVEYSDQIVIESTGAGTYAFRTGISEMFMEQDEDAAEEILAGATNLRGLILQESRTYHDGGMQWVEAEYRAEDLGSIPAPAADDFPFFGKVEWFEKDGYWHYRRQLPFADEFRGELGDSQGEELARLLLTGFQWEYTVRFPGEIVEANTSEQRVDHSSNSVSWSFSLQALSSGSRVMTAKIRVPAVPAIGSEGEEDDELEIQAEAEVSPWQLDQAEENWWLYSGRNYDTVQELVAAGAPLDERDRYGRTPLMYYAVHNVDPNIVELLIEYGADVHARSGDGFSALMHAIAAAADAEVVEALLAADSPVNARTEDGRTALSLALRSDAPAAIIDLLLQNEADPNAQELDGLTPILLAASRSSEPAIIASLIDAGADPSKRTSSGLNAPILAASLNPAPDVLELLLQQISDIDEQQAQGMPLLMWSVINTNPEVVLVVLNAGANSNQRLGDGTTVLMKAAQESINPDIIDLLLAHGADGSHKDNSGLTAFDYAHRNPDLVGTDAYWRLNDARF